MEWHTISLNELYQRLSTSLSQGLEPIQVTRKRSQYGKNEHSRPPSQIFTKLLIYVFGGFGSLLIVAGVLCCVAWKPLGEPAPAAANLALGIVLFIVAGLQAFFNAWQVSALPRPLSLTVGLEHESSHRFNCLYASI